MEKILASSKIYISKSKISNAGRGVFAKLAIKKGEIVETCPIIEVSKNDTSSLNESLLATYFLYFGKNKERIAVMLGFGSIYNHSKKPNATFKIHSKEEIVEFVALNDIKKDTEITFNYYHGNPKDKSPLWFDMYYVYILLCSDGSFYTGSTNDVKKRFKDHIEGRGARYTKSHKPIKIIYKEEFATKPEALKREAEIKKMTRTNKKLLIQSSLNRAGRKST